MANPFGKRNAAGEGNPNPEAEQAAIDPSVSDPQVDPAFESGAGGADSGSETPQGGADNPQSSETPIAETPQVDPPADHVTPPTPPPSGGKVRIKHAALKGEKEVIIGKENVKADKDGVIEVDAAQAARLLSIPGYEKA